MNKIKYLTSIVLLSVLTVGTALAQTAANFPNKPVRFIAPFPPGGSTDTLARLVSLRLSEMWGQQVAVENRGGAGGTIGVELAARAAELSAASAHAAPLASVKSLARGRSTAIGAAGALPTRAVPAWRKLAAAGR